MKDKKEENKKEPEVDYEKLYYQAMKENVLLRDKKISFEFTSEEINFLREVMFMELKDLKFDIAFDPFDEDESEENKKLGKKSSKKDEYLNSMIDEKRLMIETVIKKLRFEI